MNPTQFSPMCRRTHTHTLKIHKNPNFLEIKRKKIGVKLKYSIVIMTVENQTGRERETDRSIIKRNQCCANIEQINVEKFQNN